MVYKNSGRCWLNRGPAGVFWLLIWWLPLLVWHVDAQTLPLERIKLPPGFEISLYASGVENARSMTLSPNGTLFVGTRSAGKVYAVLDRNGDAKADEVITLARGLNSPNGVAFQDGALYVAEINRVLRFDDVERRLTSSSQPVVVNDQFPKDGHHGWKFIRFGPDGLLYVPVGAPCNICQRDPDRYAVIMRLRRDGTQLETIARGVRNTVGFDWHPQTKELWFTDNGRDWLGDDSPPDELNRAPSQGCTLGFPIVTAGALLILSLAVNARAQSSPRRCKTSVRMSRRSACAFIRARCSRKRIASRFSSPNMAPGIVPRPSAIASRWCALTIIGRYRMNPLPRAGSMMAVSGDGLSISW